MNDYFRLVPDVLLGVGGTAALLIGAWREEKPVRDFVRWSSLIVFACVAAAIPLVATRSVSYSSWANWNSLSAAFCLVFALIGAWLVLVQPTPERAAGEWYALIQFSVLGMVVLARSGNIASLFLGLETLSLALYVLIAFRYSNRSSLRGGVMYLVLASFASAFLAFGLALVYAAYATFDLAKISANFGQGMHPSPMALLGFGLFLVGVGFKLAVVPFHMWAPDVYEAAPGPISGLIASASKGAMLAALLPFGFLLATHGDALYAIAAASMIGGNLLGLLEQRVKRILAYSSIAHVGYILMALAASGAGPQNYANSWFGNIAVPQIIFFYVVAYSLAVLGAFAVVAQIENGREITVRDLRGLAKRHPLAAWLLMIFVVSLAGVPPTVGFIGKLYLFLAAIRGGLIDLALLGLVASAIGVYYYIRILAQLFMSSVEGFDVKLQRDSLRDAVLTATAGATILFGLLPGIIFSLL